MFLAAGARLEGTDQRKTNSLEVDSINKHGQAGFFPCRGGRDEERHGDSCATKKARGISPLTPVDVRRKQPEDQYWSALMNLAAADC